MVSSEKFDVVVIGAGLGGLSAAGYLAQAGKSVLVLEHHTVPGGYAHEFRRGAFRFEVALHAIDGAGPGGWAYPALRELGVLDKVRFRRLDPFYSVRFPDLEVTAHADPVEYEAELVSHFPEEAGGLRSLIDAMYAAFSEVRRFTADAAMGRRPPIESMPSRYPRMLAAMGQSWADFMGEHIEDPRLKAVFSTLWGYYGLPPSRLNAATFIFPWVSYHLFGAYYPEGGSMAMSRAIEANIKANGGTLRYGQTVTNIEMRDGRAAAVETAQGLRVETEVVVSNANAPDTMLRLVGRENLPQGYVRKIEAAKPALSNLVVYLGLERDLVAEKWPHHELFISNSYDPEAAYGAINEGRFDQTDLVMTHYTKVDPSCAPQGSSVVALFSLAPWDHGEQWGTGGNLLGYSKNPDYLRAKEDAGNRLIAQAERHLPGLREAAKYIEVATPLTNLRYSLNHGGSIYGSEQSVENMYVGRLGATTPVDNVFMAGAWVFAGGMSAALISGRDTARLAGAQFEGKKVESLYSVGAELGAEYEDGAEDPDIHAPAGELPAVTLEACGSGRTIDLRHCGKTEVLIFHGQNTAEAADAVNEAVRKRYPMASSVLCASVVDLCGVPKLFRKIAERSMRKAYTTAAAGLADGLQPEDYVIILPDWDGSITKAVGLSDVDETAAIAVIDRSGNIVGIHQGDGVPHAALNLLARAGA